MKIKNATFQISDLFNVTVIDDGRFVLEAAGFTVYPESEEDKGRFVLNEGPYKHPFEVNQTGGWVVKNHYLNRKLPVVGLEVKVEEGEDPLYLLPENRLAEGSRTGLFVAVEGSNLFEVTVNDPRIWVRDDVHTHPAEFWCAVIANPATWDYDDKTAWQWSRQDGIFFMEDETDPTSLHPITKLCESEKKCHEILVTIPDDWVTNFPEE